jgi:hypothetical protein
MVERLRNEGYLSDGLNTGQGIEFELFADLHIKYLSPETVWRIDKSFFAATVLQ